MFTRGIRKVVRQDKRRGNAKGQKVRQRNDSRKCFNRCVEINCTNGNVDTVTVHDTAPVKPKQVIISGGHCQIIIAQGEE